MDSVPHVFVVQQPSVLVNGIWQPKFSLSRAKRYGELVTLLEPGNLSDDIEPVRTHIRQALQHYAFDAARDFYLPVGEPLAMVLVARIMLEFDPTAPLQILKWNSRAKRYDLLVI